MSSFSPVLSSLLNLIVGGALAGRLVAWIWLGVQIHQRRRLLGPPLIRAVPWGLTSVGALVVAWVVLNVLVVSVYAAVTHRQRGVPLAFTEQMFLVTVLNGAALVVLPLLLRLFSGARAADFGIDLTNLGRSVRSGVVAFLIVTWPVNLIHLLCAHLWKPKKHPLEEMVRGGLDFDIAYLAVLSAIVLAPAVEEFLFRGVVQGWLTRVFVRWATAKVAETSHEWLGEPVAGDASAEDLVVDSASVGAVSVDDGRTDHAHTEDLPAVPAWATFMPIALTSAAFAVAHSAQWPAPIPIFVLSLALGVIYQRTGSLTASFVVHALFNGFSTLLLFWALTHNGGDVAKDVPPPQSVVMVRGR